MTLSRSPTVLNRVEYTALRGQAIDGFHTGCSRLRRYSANGSAGQRFDGHWLTHRRFTNRPAKPFAYEAELKLQGLVEVTYGFLQDRKEQLAFVNGFSILYSAAREMLLNITARSVYGAVTLPTISFVKLVADTLNPKEEQPKTAAPAPA